VLLSIGQSIIWGDLLKDTKVEFNRNGTIKADPLTYQTGEPDIFAGGDVYTGPKFAIDAIAAGKEAAVSLHRWVHEGQTLTAGRDRRIYRALDKSKALISAASFDTAARQQPGYNAAKARAFGDTRVTFTEEQIRKETARCLGCGATKVDEYMCIGCGQCTTRCAFDAIKLVKNNNAWGMEFEVLPLAVAKHVVKRTANIVGGVVKGKK
jgi:NAD-dependent dihydropyrimidine dehydrogenase PreA subunit